MTKENKYNGCCDKVCALGYCETRELGGCYCLCRLKDKEVMLLSLLDGSSYRVEDAVVYRPGIIPTPVGGFERINVLKELERVRERIKTYEVS